MRSGTFFSTYRADMALRRMPLEKARLALFAVFAGVLGILVMLVTGGANHLLLVNALSILGGCSTLLHIHERRVSARRGRWVRRFARLRLHGPPLKNDE